MLPAHADNWLERKRQDTLKARQAKEEMKLEAAKIKARQKADKERTKAYEREMAKMREEQEHREEEARIREEQKLALKKAEEARKNALLEEEKAAKNSVKARSRNRREALRRFDIRKGAVWVTTKPGLFAFSDKNECEEYVEYGLTNAAYAKRYARDLLDESVIQVNSKGHLKVSEDNRETLIISEPELNHTEDEELVDTFSSLEKTEKYLRECCLRKGIVLMRTFRGEEYWVAYRDLKEFAVAETKEPVETNAPRPQREPKEPVKGQPEAGDENGDDLIS